MMDLFAKCNKCNRVKECEENLMFYCCCGNTLKKCFDCEFFPVCGEEIVYEFCTGTKVNG